MGTNRCIVTVALVIGLVATPWAGDCLAATAAETLDDAQSLAASNRYSEAFALLEPLISDDLTDQTSWEIAAEAARAAFHIGKYARSHEILRRVVQARPIVFEPAVYLEATSYLMGDHRQAFAIFETILQSRVQDLYLAVTLPGENKFLAEPEVQRLLEKYAQPLVIRPRSATVQRARIGQGRLQIAQLLGIDAAGAGSVLTARAGPFLTWIYSFDDDDLLEEVILNAENLRKYTPFSLDLSQGMSWASTPITCIGSLGAPSETSATDDGALILTWEFSDARLDLVFSRSRKNDQGAATLEVIRMYRKSTDESSPNES